MTTLLTLVIEGLIYFWLIWMLIKFAWNVLLREPVNIVRAIFKLPPLPPIKKDKSKKD